MNPQTRGSFRSHIAPKAFCRKIAQSGGMWLIVLLTGFVAEGATVLWHAPNATVQLRLPFASLEFENPLAGSETVLGHRVLEWRDADYANTGGVPWYDDWTVSDPSNIDGNANEIWMRAAQQSISTTTTVASRLVSIHLLGDANDGMAAVSVDGIEVARLDMFHAGPGAQTALILVRGLAAAPHQITVSAQGAAPGGLGGVDVATLGAAALKENPTKWVQPPVSTTVTNVFNGWNEMSVTNFPNIVADDWVCANANPVTKVRWWGSFLGWTSQEPPPLLPNAFQITVWTDVPADPATPGSYSHPGRAIWQTHCTTAKPPQFAGWDYDPRTKTIEACFLFEQELESSFIQPGLPGSVLWISIAAEYWQGVQGPPWGWKTRPRDLTSPAPDAAVRIFAPPPWLITPGVDCMESVPIFWPEETNRWDMAFELISSVTSGATKWEQWPDLSPMGMDVKDTVFPPLPTLLADDFLCQSPGPITNITLWGSWLADAAPEDGASVRFTLSIHKDVPLGPAGHSIPGDVVWLRTFEPQQFRVSVFASNLQEGWFEPPGMYLFPGDTRCYQYDFDIPVAEAFQQTGTPNEPVVYWLDAQAQVIGPTTMQFGWKTCITNWHDIAVWANASEPGPFPPDIWHLLDWQGPRDLAFRLNAGGAATTHEIKWSQRPVLCSELDAYHGWNLLSVYGESPVAADDWVCTNASPVTDVHWWGSFIGWSLPQPPDVKPDAFYLTIWTDVPAGTGQLGFSHPGQCLWMAVCTNFTWEFAGWDIDPRNPQAIPEACFRFDHDLLPGEYFHQNTGTNTYWLSIAAFYQNYDAGTPHWGWKTRPRASDSLAADSAVLIDNPTAPLPGMAFVSGVPIRWPYSTNAWDLAFTLTTQEEILPTADFGDAPDGLAALGYPTLLANNGARHTVVPGVTLGGLIDAELDGQPTAAATGDDLTNLADEDGVTLTTLLVPGETATVQVAASANGYLSAWLDFNANRSWADASDQIFTNVALTAGTTSLNFHVPLASARGSNTFARFRFSTAAITHFTGLATDGEVEDYRWHLEELDFGDAMDPSYPTLRANNGARHILLQGVGLGALRDSEQDGQPNAAATGDDLSGLADEDGVTLLTPLLPGQTATVQVNASIAGGLLNAWVDFNLDGSWATPGDQIFTNTILASGPNSLTFKVPLSVVAATQPVARFRFSTMPNLGFFGLAPNGEVEDYQWRIEAADFGDAPDPSFPTRLANNGAQHVVGPMFMGAAIDAELDGQPNANATGDDAANQDDEDGVVFGAALISGVPNTVTVTTSIGGYLQAWLDLNADGDWADAGEQVIQDRLLGPGANAVNFLVPSFTLGVTKTFMRFRLSGMLGLGYTGLAPDGEVEDYEVKIEPLKWLQRPELGWEGVDVDNFWVRLADDFKCTQTGPITDFHLWGSFVRDVLPATGLNSLTITLFIYTDVPAGVDSTYSHPGQLLWSRTFQPGTYSAGHMFYQPDGEWWHDPATRSWQAAADRNIYQYDFYVDPREAFSQLEGTTYWLGMKYTPGDDDFTFGWKTTYEPWQDDACWLDTSVTPALWRDLHYGDGHPWAQRADNSMNLAFAVSGKQGEAFDFGDTPDGAAVPRYPTLLINNGARHAIVAGVRLGSLIDAEQDGQPNFTATGDDVANLADEDGVVLFGSHMIPGGLSGVAVTPSANGYLSAWVDFHIDGSWATSGDQIFTNVWVTNGINNLYYKVPFAIPRATNTFARFRFSTSPLTNFTGLAADGEVEDYRWYIRDVDFGDAPEPAFPTRYANNGAYHWLMQGVFLGAVVDAETDGQPNANATGDDLTALADEDGVMLLTPLVPGTMATAQVSASIGGAWLNAWVDFGADGSWATPGDQIIVNAIPIAGLNVYTFLVPASAPAGSNVIARFRFSTAANLSYTNVPGQVPNGEVEDHQWRIAELDFGDAPDPTFPTLLANDGARHGVGPLFLGARVDAENDGQPDVYAAGDDKNPPTPNDEDGVSFPTALIANAPATIRVVSSGPGVLEGWFDFDGDGAWITANEHAINNRPVVAGVNIIQIFLPANVVAGRSYARFRLSTQPRLTFTGAAPDGEVEDYAITFHPLKWNLPPEQGPEGVDVDDSVKLADDFLCRQSGPITDIHLWGSFRNDLLPLGGPGSMNITLTIYADVPAGPSFSHPGQALWTRTFAPGQFTAGLAMTEASEWYHDPRLPQPIWLANADTNIWQFDFYLAATNAFQQASNMVYWLGVQYKPLDNDTAYSFGWKTTYLQWNDAACWFNPAGGNWLPLLYGDGHPRADDNPPMNQMDFAFALSTETSTLDWGDAPDPTYPTQAANNGARHLIVPGLMLGNLLDAEGDGQPNAGASGDDLANLDDEDGVFFPLLVPGQLGTANVNVTGTGFLNAWVDFAADGSWAQAGDQIATNLPVTTGAHGIWFTVPTNTPWGQTAFARFRLSTQPNLSYTGLAPDGEVEDHAMAISPLPGTDLGDAPDSSNSAGPPAVMTAYPGVQANFPTVFIIGSPPFGPIHQNPGVAFLGAGFSGEQEADMGPDQDFVNNLNPLTDVANADAFDDGLMGPVILPHCTSGLIQVFVTAPAPPAPLFLNAWFDWNRDGDWNDILNCPDGNPALEWAVQNMPAPPGAGLVPLPVIKAWHPSLDKKPIWIRITLSEIPVPGPQGWAGAGGDGPGGAGYQFGETEDYLLTDYDDNLQFDFGDAPSSYPVVLPNGARHLIVPNFHLGGQITDAESDGLPHALSLGDDLNNIADEDGVTFPTPLLVNTNGCVDVSLVGLVGGRLDGWLDFDRSGTWDTGEQVFNATLLANGNNPGLCFPIPNTAKLGTNFARFRLSSGGGLPPTGVVQDGEVEDYQVTLWQRRPTTNVVITWIGVTNSTPTNQVVAVQWNAETNVHYEVLAAPSLGTNNGTDIVWSVISPEIIGPSNRHTLTNTSTKQQYYRVRAPWVWP